jgi:hypothetical protein
MRTGKNIMQSSIKRVAALITFLTLVTQFQLFQPVLLASDNTVIIIIDGARYSETFGDTNHTFIPQMWNISQQGTYIDSFYNDSITYTYRAIPALWTGSWTAVRDTFYNGNWTKYSVKPSIFEYYRKQKNIPAEKVYYVLKYISSLWLPSFDQDYGPNYWPTFHSYGTTDDDVDSQAQWVMDTYQPSFLWIYLADVDNYGHSGDWQLYTKAIQKADSIVALIWNKIQSDSFYQNSTTLFVTNDHGRHDDQHGGFSGHGGDCEGCRHIMFLALGPEIKQNYVSTQYRRIPDMAVTAAALMNINPEQSTGKIMTEILSTTGMNEKIYDGIPQKISLAQNYPNPFNQTTTIIYSLNNSEHVKITVYNAKGQLVKTLFNGFQTGGSYSVIWDASNVSSGIYFYRLTAGDHSSIQKCVILK